MKIKKPSPAGAPAPAPGGAVVADRFKLDMPQSAPAPSGGAKIFTTVSLVAALASLAILGLMVMYMSQSWDQIRFL